MNEHSIFILASGLQAIVIVCLVGWINSLHDKIEQFRGELKHFNDDVNIAIGRMEKFRHDAIQKIVRDSPKQEAPTQEMPTVKQAKNWRSVQEFLQPK